jgi:hypothetical protein
MLVIVCAVSHNQELNHQWWFGCRSGSSVGLMVWLWCVTCWCDTRLRIGLTKINNAIRRSMYIRIYEFFPIPLFYQPMNHLIIVLRLPLNAELIMSWTPSKESEGLDCTLGVTSDLQMLIGDASFWTSSYHVSITSMMFKTPNCTLIIRVKALNWIKFSNSIWIQIKFKSRFIFDF